MDSPFSSSSPLATGSYRPPSPPVTAASFASLLPGIGVAIAVGALYHLIGRFLDLIIVFPLAAGCIVGAFLASRAEKSKVRSKVALGTLGVFCGMLCFGTRVACDSLYHRELVLPVVAAKWAGNKPQNEPVIENQLRAQFPPLAYLPIYLKAAAEEGVTITSTHDVSGTSSNRPITGTGFWALFLGDALMITGAAAAVALGQAKKPFCEPCDKWYGPDLTVTRLHPNQSDAALQLVQSGDYTGLGNLRGQGASETQNCDVILTKCNGCGAGQLKLVTKQNKKVKTLWQGKPQPGEIKTLEEVRAQWLK